jgi:long-chain alkane monooxygenase
VFADPVKVHEVNHESFSVAAGGRSLFGRLKGAQSYGRPAPRIAVAILKHVEAIFAVHPNVKRMWEYTDDLEERLKNQIWPPG